MQWYYVRLVGPAVVPLAVAGCPERVSRLVATMEIHDVPGSTFEKRGYSAAVLTFCWGSACVPLAVAGCRGRVGEWAACMIVE